MKRVFYVLQCIAISTPVLTAQITGTITGTVHDPQGAVVPRAAVTATNTATRIARSVVSDSVGDYVIPLLPIGEYQLTVDSPGFQKAASNIILEAQQTARIDFTLEVGAVAAQTTVEAETPVLKADTSDIGTVIDNQRMVDLPMNGRNFIALNALDAGASTNTGSRTQYFTQLFGGSFSFNGSPGDSSTYSVDGIIAKGMGDSRVTLQLSIDTIQEFNQQSSLYSAEFSGGGGNVNVVTRSGTNQFHGSAWEFLRNTDLDARNFFDPKNTSPFRQNQFGGTIGGPIRRDKTFFFASYEGLRNSKTVGQVFTVPTPPERQGNFAGIATIYDPSTTVLTGSGTYTRQPFPNNVIPASEFSPVSQAALGLLYPLPNAPGLTRNLNSAFTNAVTDDQTTGKIDERLSDKNTLTARYTYEYPRRFNTTYASLPNFADFWNNTSQSAVISDTHILTTQIVNEAHLGLNRMYQYLVSTLHNQDIPDEIGITGTQAKTYPGPPAISITGIGTTGSLSNTPNNRGEDTFQFGDNLSYVRGAHSLGMGVDLRELREDGGTASSSRGSFTFIDSYSALPGVAGTGNAVADFDLGYPSSASVSIGNGFTDIRQFLTGVYIKDDWKATPHLTLNLGLRYEYFTPLSEVRNRIPSFNFNTGVEYPVGVNGVSNYLYRPDYKNFAPRFGLAYRPFGREKTVIRTGYGIFYSPILPYLGWSAGQSAPNLYSASVVDNANIPNISLANAFPPALLSISSAVVVIDRGLVTPYDQEWSFGVQQEVMKNTVLDVSYLGNKGTHLVGGSVNLDQAVPGPGAIPARRPYPAYTSVSTYLSDGKSNYNALRVNLKRNLYKGVTFTASYVWSKMIDTVDTAFLAETGNNAKRDLRDPDAERGLAAFDSRQRLVFNYVWQLPLGHGRFRQGWQVSGIFTLQTGSPIDVGLSYDNSNTGNSGSLDRPNCVANPNTNAPHTVFDWFNEAAFAAPVPYTFGNCGKNVITGPGIEDIDFLLSKTFAPVERLRIQFRNEFFNILNHPNFNPPNATYGNPLFGQIASAGDGREIQFALKFIF
jgi:Carboxypeptidase regulatory-like domain/TonB dependent receptor